MVARVLIPTDFSEIAADALALARESFPNATLRLLHVLEPSSTALKTPTQVELAQAEIEQETLMQLEALRQEGEEVAITTGKTVEAILEYARLYEPDLIVMGTLGRTGLAHFLNGSIAERVIRHAHLPVLVVPEKRRLERTKRKKKLAPE